jgi:hypothetical protein
MLRTNSVRSVCVRLLVLFTCLGLLVSPAVAGVAGQSSQPAAPQTPATGDAAATSLAGTTTVSLSPSSAGVDEGKTRTFSVVVSESDGGVGAVSGSISVAEPEHVEITDFEFNEEPGIEDVSLSESTVEFEAAAMERSANGEVTIATVTVRGRVEGTTDLALSVDSLGDQDGTPYEVGGTPDAAVTVKNNLEEVPLSINVDDESATAGETVSFTVVRDDSDAGVEATVTVGDRTVNTGFDGTASVVVRESMVSDAGTITAVASKDATSQERFLNDSVTFEYSTSDDTTGDGGDSNETGGGAIVRSEPGSVDVAAGERTTIDVVVANIDGEVRAGDLTVTLPNADVVEVVDAAVVGEPGVGGAEIRNDNATVDAEFALRESTDDPPIRILTLSVRGTAPGTTPVSITVTSLGDENGNSYDVASAPDGSIDVRDGDTASETTTGDEEDATTERQPTTSSASSTTESGTDETSTSESAPEDDGSSASGTGSSGGGGQGLTNLLEGTPLGGQPLFLTVVAVSFAVAVFIMGLLIVAAS